MNTPNKLPSITHLIQRADALLNQYGNYDEGLDNCLTVVSSTDSVGTVRVCRDQSLGITTIEVCDLPDLEEEILFKFRGADGAAFDRKPDTLMAAAEVIKQLEAALAKSK